MNEVIIYAVTASVISLIIVSLLLFLLIQRRRQRAMQLLALAQEDAERRRRNRKKAGLRRWEIDSVCPEAVFTHHGPAARPVVYTLQSSPADYLAAVARLPRPPAPADSLPASPASRAAPPPQPPAPVPAPPPAFPPRPDLPVRPEVPPAAIALPPAPHTCVICLDDVAVGNHVRVLPCAHVYHAHCIRVWLRRKNACPCCCDKVLKRRRKRPLPTALAPVRPTRLDDRPEDTTIEMERKSFMDEIDLSSDRVNSESSSHLDEPSAAELLYHVRRALRGESSMISLNTSAADWDDVAADRSLPEVASFGGSSIGPDEHNDEHEEHDEHHENDVHERERQLDPDDHSTPSVDDDPSHDFHDFPQQLHQDTPEAFIDLESGDAIIDSWMASAARHAPQRAS